MKTNESSNRLLVTTLEKILFIAVGFLFVVNAAVWVSVWALHDDILQNRQVGVQNRSLLECIVKHETNCRAVTFNGR